MLVIARHGLRVEALGERRQASDVITARSAVFSFVPGSVI